MKHNLSLSTCGCKKCYIKDISQELLHNIDNPSLLKQLVLNGANVNFQTNTGWCPLFEAISLNLEQSVQTLIDLGANIQITDKQKRNALFWAIYNGHPNMVRILLDKGIDLTADVFPGLNATKYSIETKNIVILDLLLNHSPIPKTKQFKLNKRVSHEYY